MLYKTLKKLIASGKTEGLAEKLDVYFALGRLTEAEYSELMALLG